MNNKITIWTNKYLFNGFKIANYEELKDYVMRGDIYQISFLRCNKETLKKYIDYLNKNYVSLDFLYITKSNIKTLKNIDFCFINSMDLSYNNLISSNYKIIINIVSSSYYDCHSLSFNLKLSYNKFNKFLPFNDKINKYIITKYIYIQYDNNPIKYKFKEYLKNKFMLIYIEKKQLIFMNLYNNFNLKK